MNQEKAHDLAFQVVEDMGGAFVMANGYLGDRLGLFEALADAGPLTSGELAERTGLNERYVREWARAMVAAEYIEYDADGDRYRMTEEQAFVLADQSSPLFVGGAFHFTTPSMWAVPEIETAFREGGGVEYGDLPDEIPRAIERFFAPGYRHLLTSEWLAAVPGLVDRLEAGARVADVGCGRGRSTIAMARAFPNSEFVGVDLDEDSVAGARELAATEGVDNATFVADSAESVAEEGPFDLICSFDCIHDMVDPVGVLKAIRAGMAYDGVYVWGEPNASADPVENRNPVGRSFSAISPLHCLTVSLAHQGAGLGTVIGEKGARELADKAGFSRFERLPIDHPFNQFFALAK